MKKLYFSNCEQFDFCELLPCIALEKLFIWGTQTKFNENDLPSIDFKTFLPNLKILTSHVCLGKSGSILEEQLSSLVSLDLNCSHLGTIKASKFNWDSIPPGWSNLQKLKFNSAVGLSIEKVYYLISKLNRITNLTLPRKMLTSEAQKELAKDLKHQLLNGPSKCHLDFQDYGKTTCPYQEKKPSSSSLNPKKPRLEFEYL